jgi:hypothetical protein
MRRLFFFIVLAFACGMQAQGSFPDRDGERLRRVRLSAADGTITSQDNTFYDTKLQQRCLFVETTSGTYYCVPPPGRPLPADLAPYVPASQVWSTP